MKAIVAFIYLSFYISSINAQYEIENASRWSQDRVNRWYTEQKWIVGVNYIPSTSVNQLEMWQTATFDSVTIRRELEWAANIGFNTIRVYLHHLVWLDDSAGYFNRIDQFLKIANANGIKTVFVLFEDVWNGFPTSGKQQPPIPGVHNSRWVQDPGQYASTDTAMFPLYAKYVTNVIERFKHDSRILFWDLYNEPGSNKKGNSSLALLKLAFTSARRLGADQPITAGLWRWNADSINCYLYQNSDIITYHNYDPPESHSKILFGLKLSGRPVICTEYMARRRNSRFKNILPMLKRESVGAISWGLVKGKTNTIFQWDTPIYGGIEPYEWFHDLLRSDGTPYDENELNFITGTIKMESRESRESIIGVAKSRIVLTIHIVCQNILALLNGLSSSSLFLGIVASLIAAFYKNNYLNAKRL